MTSPDTPTQPEPPDIECPPMEFLAWLGALCPTETYSYNSQTGKLEVLGEC